MSTIAKAVVVVLGVILIDKLPWSVDERGSAMHMPAGKHMSELPTGQILELRGFPCELCDFFIVGEGCITRTWYLPCRMHSCPSETEARTW